MQKTQRGLRPQPTVAITLRRDKHLSNDVRQPKQGCTVSAVAWGLKDNQRGIFIHVALF